MNSSHENSVEFDSSSEEISLADLRKKNSVEFDSSDEISLADLRKTYSAKFDSSDDIPLANLRITHSQTYTTSKNTTVTIDDGKLKHASKGKFHPKYKVVTDLCETDNSVLWVGERKGYRTYFRLQVFILSY